MGILLEIPVRSFCLKHHICLPFYKTFLFLDIDSKKGTKNTSNTALLRTIIGEKRKLRKNAKLQKSARRKYLKKQAEKYISSKRNDDNIFNMSNIELKEADIKLLNKGLSFIDTPKPIPLKITLQSLLDFGRRMRIHYFFRNETNETPINPFRLKSCWEPDIEDNDTLMRFLDNIEHQIRELYTQPLGRWNNLTEDEKEALKKLATQNEVTIKRCDKGGKIALWPNDLYLNEAYKQLNNEKYYKELPIDKTGEIATLVTTFLTHLRSKGHIDNDLYTYLSPSSKVRTPIFYMLPKIHKEGIPGRPIISGCGSPTEKLSIYLDYYLRPIVEKSDSFIKDTTHFLQTLFSINDNDIPENA